MGSTNVLMLVVDRQRPEPVDRRRAIFRECHGVAARAGEPVTVLVEVLVEILRLVRGVDEDVGLGDCRAREVVGAERRLVRDGAPVVRELLAVVPELEKRLHEPLVGLFRTLGHRLFQLPVTAGGVQHGEHLGVAGLLSVQRRGISEHVDEFLGHDPLSLLLTGRWCWPLGEVRPVSRLPCPVVVRNWIPQDPGGSADWIARLSSGVSSWKTRGAANPVFVGQRNTFVMPVGTSPSHCGPTSR